MTFDTESKESIERIVKLGWAKNHRIPGVRTVLVILPGTGMPYDIDSLRQKILISYPDAAVFFFNTGGTPLGAAPPEQLDLLIDLTGPGQRQPFFLARKLRRMARVAVGRRTGWFRERLYDVIYDEKAETATLPSEPTEREREIEKKIFGLSGVMIAHSGDTSPDRGSLTPRELPPLQRSPSLL